MLKRFYNSVMLKGDAKIAISPFIHEHIRQIYGPKIRAPLYLISRGVDTSKTLLKTKHHHPQHLTLVLPGRFSRKKGHQTLLEGLASLPREKIQKISGLFCGKIPNPLPKDKAYAKELQQFIDNKNLAHVASLVLYTDDLEAYYRQADWIVVPTQKPEGFGLVIAEAGAMGKPVMTYDEGAAKDIVVHQKNGVALASTNTRHHFYPKALEISPAERQQMGENARKHIQKHFSLHDSHKKNLPIYNKLLSGSSVLPL